MINQVPATAFEAMDLFPYVPKKYLNPIYNRSGNPIPKYVLPNSSEYTARINLIDYLTNFLYRFGSKSQSIDNKNKTRLKAYNKLQAKLLKCETTNKPIKVSLLDNMARILKNMAKDSSAYSNLRNGIFKII